MVVRDDLKSRKVNNYKEMYDEILAEKKRAAQIRQEDRLAQSTQPSNEVMAEKQYRADIRQQDRLQNQEPEILPPYQSARTGIVKDALLNGISVRDYNAALNANPSNEIMAEKQYYANNRAQDRMNTIPSSEIPTVEDNGTTSSIDNAEIMAEKKYRAQNRQQDRLSQNTTPDATQTTDTTQTSTTDTTTNDNIKTNMWDLYKAQLAQSSVNQKAELAAINQRANNYVNAYLKSLGLSGTSAGASQIAQNSANLMNAYSEVNANEQQALNAYEKEQQAEKQSQMLDLFNTAISNGASYSDINDIIDRNTTSDAEANYYREYLAASGINWTTDKDDVINTIDEQLDTRALTENQIQYANELKDKLTNASTEEEYMKIYNDNKDIIKNLSNIPQNATISESETDTKETPIKANANQHSLSNEQIQELNNNKSIKYDKPLSINASEEDFGDFNGTGDKNDTQSIWVNLIQRLARRGAIQQGTIINMNVGRGSRTNPANYIFLDNQWYPVTFYGNNSKYYSHFVESSTHENGMKDIRNLIKDLVGSDDIVDKYLKEIGQ